MSPTILPPLRRTPLSGTPFSGALPSRRPERAEVALSLLMLLIMGGLVSGATWHEAHGLALALLHHHAALAG